MLATDFVRGEPNSRFASGLLRKTITRYSIAIIARFWRSMKHEYVRHLFLYRSAAAIETRIRRYGAWFNEERPHQGLGQRTPDDVYFDRPAKPTRNITGGTLHVRFLDGDKRLPVMRLHRAA